MFNSNGQIANMDRLHRGVAANSLTVDLQNINRVVGLAPFTGASNQVWSSATF